MKESCYLFLFLLQYFAFILKKRKKLASQAYGFNFARKKKDPKEKSNKKPNWPILSWWANRGQFPLCGPRPSLTLSKPGGTSSDFNPAPFGSAVSLSGGVCHCTDTNQVTKSATLLCLPTKEPLPLVSENCSVLLPLPVCGLIPAACLREPGIISKPLVLI